MAKFSGLSTSVLIDNTGGTPVDVSNDVSSINLNIPVGEQIVTGLDKTGEERLQLLQDATVTFGGRGLASSATRAILFEALGTQRTVTINFPDSATVAFEAFLFNPSISRGDDGGITWSVEARLSNGTVAAWS